MALDLCTEVFRFRRNFGVQDSNATLEEAVRIVKKDDGHRLTGGTIYVTIGYIMTPSEFYHSREVRSAASQYLWQKAILGLACVANESAHVNQVLDQAVNVIQSVPTIQLLRSRIELL